MVSNHSQGKQALTAGDLRKELVGNEASLKALYEP
ncbi:hypothetical protein VIAG107301_15900 [Vibrio agarivorans]